MLQTDDVNGWPCSVAFLLCRGSWERQGFDMEKSPSGLPNVVVGFWLACRNGRGAIPVFVVNK